MGIGEMTAIIVGPAPALSYPFHQPIATVIGTGVTLWRVYRCPFIGPFRFLVMGTLLTDIQRGRHTARKISIGDWIMRYAKGITTERMVPAGSKSRMTTRTSPASSVNSA